MSKKITEKQKEVFELSKVNTQMLINISGIYAIRCKENNMHLIGETRNIKNRIPKHFEALKKNNANAKFAEDFKKYGIEKFELIIYEKGEKCDDFIYRKNIERQLITELAKNKLCYNSGYSETLSDRPKGEFPTSSGIYCIPIINF